LVAHLVGVRVVALVVLSADVTVDLWGDLQVVVWVALWAARRVGL